MYPVTISYLGDILNYNSRPVWYAMLTLLSEFDFGLSKRLNFILSSCNEILRTESNIKFSSGMYSFSVQQLLLRAEESLFINYYHD